MDLAELGYKVSTSDIDRADRSLDKMGGSADKAAGSMTGMERSVVRAAASLAAMVVSVQALSRGVGTLAAYGQEMSTVRAITQATASEFSALSDEAQRLGATTRFSASEAAQGMAFLARAGFSAQEALAATEGTLTLAQAGALGLGQAADIASNVLTGFRLEVAETGRVVDVLAFTANNANTTVGQLGEAMSMVAPVAAGLGVSVEETAAAVAALSDAGIQSTRAGTGLRRVLATLESPTAQAAAIIEDLGLKTDDVRVSSVGLTAAMSALARAGIDTGTALELFGDRGGPAFEVLSSSIPRVQEMNTALQGATGTAERIATVMDDNLNGALLAIRSASEAVTLRFGEMSGTGLEDTARGIAAGLRLVADNAELITHALGAGAVGFAAYRTQLLLTSAGVGRFTLVLGGMTTGMGRAIIATRALTVAKAALMGPLGIAILAATSAAGAFALMGISQREQARRAEDAAEAQERYNAAMQEAARIDPPPATFQQSIDEAARLGTQALEGLSREAIEARNNAIAAVSENMASVQQGLEDRRNQIQSILDDIERRYQAGLMNPSGQALSRDAFFTPEIEQALFDLRRDLAEGERALESFNQRRQELLNTPIADFDPDNAPIDERAYTEAERSLQQQLQLVSMRSDLERQVASALLDAGLALDSQGDEAENIRNLVTQIHAVTERRAQAEERIREAQALAARQDQSLEDARQRLALLQIEDDTRRAIEEQVVRAGFAMNEQSAAADELRVILAKVLQIETARSEAAQKAADIERARQNAERAIGGLQTELRYEAGGDLVWLQDERDQRLSILREAQAQEQQLIEDGILREGELMAMRNEILRNYEQARSALLLDSYATTFGALTSLAETFAGEQSGIYRALFLTEKAFALSSAIINAHLAISKAAASAPAPFNIPAIALASAQTLPQVAMIAAQTAQGFYSGGYTGNGPLHGVAGVVHGQEYVLNNQATRGIGQQALDHMNRTGSLPPANDNGGSGGGGGNTVYIDARGATKDAVAEMMSQLKALGYQVQRLDGSIESRMDEHQQNRAERGAY